MVPSRLIRLKPLRIALRQRFRALQDLARPLAWAMTLWVVVIALPYAWLYPGERLQRPICMALVGLPPFAALLVASTGQARTLLTTGLGALIPPLVACPELLSPRVTSALQGLAVAGLIVIFIASALDAERGPAAAVSERLRSLLRPGGNPAVPVLGLAWASMAWFGEGDRVARIALVATTWMAVQLFPLGAAPVASPTTAWWLRRGGLAALLLALWGWW